MADLTLEQVAEDLSLASELDGDWAYGLDETGQLIAQHYGDEGQIDQTVKIHITFEAA